MSLTLNQVASANDMVQQLTDIVNTLRASKTTNVPHITLDIPDAAGVHFTVDLPVTCMMMMLQSEGDRMANLLSAAGVNTTGWMDLS